MPTTIAKLRRALFSIYTPAADALRHELFELEDQDAPVPEALLRRYQQLSSTALRDFHLPNPNTAVRRRTRSAAEIPRAQCV